MRLDAVIDLRLDGRDLRRVRKLPVPPRRPDPGPPDVDVLLGRGAVRGVATALSPAEEDAEVRVEGVLGVRGTRREEVMVTAYDQFKLRIPSSRLRTLEVPGFDLEVAHSMLIAIVCTICWATENHRRPRLPSPF